MALAAARLEGRVHWRVAQDAGIDPATLSRILNRLREPTADEAQRIASALGATVLGLFASSTVVQEWLGHEDPGFTLRTYIHLLDGGVGTADFFDTLQLKSSTWEAPSTIGSEDAAVAR